MYQGLYCTERKYNERTVGMHEGEIIGTVIITVFREDITSVPKVRMRGKLQELSL